MTEGGNAASSSVAQDPLDAKQVLLERSLACFAEIAARTFDRDYHLVPSAGAAGGLGFSPGYRDSAHLLETRSRELVRRERIFRAVS